MTRFDAEMIEQAKDDALACIRREFDAVNFAADVSEMNYSQMRAICEARLDEALSVGIASDSRLAIFWLAKLAASCVVQMAQIMEGDGAQSLNMYFTGEHNGSRGTGSRSERSDSTSHQ